MLPIHIGNVSLDKKLHSSQKGASPSSAAAGDTPASISTTDTSTSMSATTSTLPPRPTPKPVPRPAPRFRISSYNSPSAPPAEYHPVAEGRTPVNNGDSNKRQSQLVSPNAFSYAPGLFLSQDPPHSGPGTTPSDPLFSGSTVDPAPYPIAGASLMPTPLILPPNYSTSRYPQGQLAHSHTLKKA